MKTFLSLCLALGALTTAHAQVFRSGTLVAHAPGPVVSAGVNYSRGGHDSHRGRDGFAYRDYGRSYFGYRNVGYGYYGPRFVYDVSPSYGYYGGYGDGYPYYSTGGYYGGGSSAGNGLVLGALAGGIIGNNSGSLHHSGWRGAAWGAGIGWLLGSVADANRAATVYRQPVVVQPAPVQVQAQPAPVAQPTQPLTIINNYYNTSTPMSGANGLFGR